MTLFLNIIIVLLCFIIIGAVLLQPSKGGAVFGSSQSVFGGAGATSFLFRLTMICAFLIMTLSLFLAWSHTQKTKNSVIRAENLSATSTLPVVPQNPAAESALPAESGQSAPAAPTQPNN